ncbi:MAG: ATP-grasp domain-containing protein [Patescibacteria group bacterium]
MRRKIMITSVGTGVGNAIITAARKSSHLYEVIATNTEPFHSGVFRSDYVSLAEKSDVSTSKWINVVKKTVAEKRPKMLLPGRDADITYLSQYKSELEEMGTKVICAPKDVIEKSNDKMLSVKLFEEMGLDYAKTINATDKDSVDRFIEEQGFPLILKPKNGTGTIGVKLVNSKQEILEITKNHPHIQYILQEFIKISSKNLHSITSMTPLVQDHEYSIQIIFNQRSEMIGHFSSINTLENGLPVAVRTVDLPETQDAIQAICLKKHRITGPLNIQGRVKNRKIIFFEANPRCTGITGTRAGLGFNEVDALWESFVEGKDIKMPVIEPGLNAYRNLEDTFFSQIELDKLIRLKKWAKKIK